VLPNRSLSWRALSLGYIIYIYISFGLSPKHWSGWCSFFLLCHHS
jgi:hypothetical protein